MDDSDAGPVLESFTCALGTSDLEDHALCRKALDCGDFRAVGLAVDLEISDAKDAVAAVLAGRADIALTTSEAVIKALVDGEPLAVLSLLFGKAIVTQEAPMLGERASAVEAFLWAISTNYGRALVAAGREGRT